MSRHAMSKHLAKLSVLQKPASCNAAGTLQALPRGAASQALKTDAYGTVAAWLLPGFQSCHADFFAKALSLLRLVAPGVLGSHRWWQLHPAQC